jgi:transposase-like protein
MANPGKELYSMEKRKWTNQQKLQIVLEGLSGQIDISKLCAKYQVSQTQYYKWRDQLLKHGTQAFEVKNVSKKEQRLVQENLKLRRIIGDLTVELKKTEIELNS